MHDRAKSSLIAVIFLVFFYLLFEMLKPFFDSLMWALVFSVVSFIPHGWLVKRTENENLAAAIMLIAIMVGILIPLFFLVQLLIVELGETYRWIDSEWPKIRELDPSNIPIISGLWKQLSKYMPTDADVLGTNLLQYLKTTSKTLVNYFSFAFVNVLGFAFNFIIMIIALFFFLRDGDRILKSIATVLPFKHSERIRLISQLKDMIIATLYGGLSVAVVQGLIGGTAFWLLGINAPVLWGTVMAFLAFVPVLGAGIIWGPAVIGFAVYGHHGKAFILLFVGVFLISMVDYVLRPIVIGTRTKMHTLVIFLSVLGGLSHFGFVGVIVGPMVALTCMALISIYVDNKNH